MSQQKAYWVQGTPKLLDRSQKFWYNACPRCFKSVRSIPEWPIVCVSCNTNVRVSPRYDAKLHSKKHLQIAIY